MASECGPGLRAAAGDGTALIDKAFEAGEIPDLEAAIFEARRLAARDAKG